ncbi:hypothetical protein V501_03333 [Pseudogymnoascus sp. VKM F-4519 (FW-2642)]|nr:hypothetical protein V501_03333 [Pseudogymnoascus sp. VKM F-4519 (FW-2642)]
MEHAARKELEQRLGATHRPVPADSSAGVSLSGLTEHSAERGFTSGVAAPERSMTLKRKASATKSTLADKAGPSSQQSTAITEPGRGDSSYDGGGVMGPGARARRERAAGGDGVRAVAGAKASQVGVWAGEDECNGGF